MTPDEMAELAGVQAPGEAKAAEVLASLDALTVKIRAADRIEAGQIVAEVLRDAQQVTDCALLARTRPNDWGAWLLSLRSIRGMATAADALNRAIKAENQPPARLAVAGEADEWEGPDCLPDGWRAPDGWSVRPNGVWRDTDDGVEMVASRPVWVVAYYSDVDGHGHSIGLAWRMIDGSDHQQVVPMSVAADSRGIVPLADDGLPVTSATARLLTLYIDAALTANATILPRAAASGRFGWMPGGGFLLGSRYIGPVEHAVQLMPDDGLKQRAESYSVKGTWDGWLAEVVAPAADSPFFWLTVYNAIASILIHPLDLPDNWVIDRSGETSKGKSTLGRAGFSVWGDPRAMPSWDATPAGVEGHAAMLCHLPVVLDDSKKARAAEAISAIVYRHSGTMGGLRGKPAGRGRGVGVRVSESWRSAMDSSGEQALTSFTQDAGLRGRVLCLRGDPLADGNAAVRITTGAHENYGHLGTRVVELLTSGGIDPWRAHWEDAYRAAREALQPHGAIPGRLAYVVAALMMGRMVAESAGLPAPPDDVNPIGMAQLAAIAAGGDADMPAAALMMVHSLAVAKMSAFWGRHESDRNDGSPREPGGGGWLGAWDRGDGWEYLSLRVEVMHEALDRQGYDRGIIDRWRERGWLAPHAGRGNQARVRINGELVNAYRLTRRAIDALVDSPAG